MDEFDREINKVSDSFLPGLGETLDEVDRLLDPNNINRGNVPAIELPNRDGGFDLGDRANPWDFIFEATTGENARELRKNMESAGESFGSGDYAHHMVPSTHQRGQDARSILERYGIDINDAINGTRLTQEQHYGQGLHSHRGIDEVTRRLRTAQSREDVEAILQKIKDDIRNRTLLP